MQKIVRSIRNKLTRIRIADRLERKLEILTEYGFCRLNLEYKTITWEKHGEYPLDYDDVLDLMKNSLWYASEKPNRNGKAAYDPWLEVWYIRRFLWTFVIVDNNKYVTKSRRMALDQNEIRDRMTQQIKRGW